MSSSASGLVDEARIETHIEIRDRATRGYAARRGSGISIDTRAPTQFAIGYPIGGHRVDAIAERGLFGLPTGSGGVVRYRQTGPGGNA